MSHLFYQVCALDHANVGTADLDYSSGHSHRNENTFFATQPKCYDSVDLLIWDGCQHVKKWITIILLRRTMRPRESVCWNLVKWLTWNWVNFSCGKRSENTHRFDKCQCPKTGQWILHVLTVPLHGGEVLWTIFWCTGISRENTFTPGHSPHPGAHFTKDFSIVIKNRWKIDYVAIDFLAITSLQRYAHAATAQLLCHVKNIVPITQLEFRWEQNYILIEFISVWNIFSDTGPMPA